MTPANIDLASPATTTSTNRGNKGGRPRDWTFARARRLTRLYLYTNLPLHNILDLLKEDVWQPGKEAANKILNGVLGKDPRWMRPRTVEDQRQRIHCLKNSERAPKKDSRPPQHAIQPHRPASGVYYNSFLNPETDTLDGATITRSAGSSYEKPDDFVLDRDTVNTLYDWNSRFDFVPPSTVPLSHVNLGQLPNSSRTTLSRFFPRGISRQGTAMTTSTDFTTASTRTREAFGAVQEKLQLVSDLTQSDVKDVFRVFKRYTISAEPEAHDSRSAAVFSPSIPTNVQHSTNQFGSIRRQPTSVLVTQKLAGDLVDVNALCQQQCYIPKSAIHDTTACDCQLRGIKLDVVDPFGNTAYHHFAATEGHQDLLIQSFCESFDHSDFLVGARNTAGQTFLHVLHSCWYDEESQLSELLSILKARNFPLYATDVYGRTFFHILGENLTRNPHLLREITRNFDMENLECRDAFGVKPMTGIRRVGTMPSVQEEGQEGLGRLTIPPGDAQARTRIQAQLVKIINDAFAIKPTIEDAQGRNALHCLAEVAFDANLVPQEASRDEITHSPVSKRKLDDNYEPKDSCPLSYRMQYLGTLLEAGVDVNHYNSKGDTVLMAFVSHITDGKYDKDLEAIIKILVKEGANLEARNRNGETALHVAARLGQKRSVKCLIEQGANVYARNGESIGILPVIDRLWRMTEDDHKFNLRLEACRAVLTGQYGDKNTPEQNPTAEQEWAFRPKLPPDSAKSRKS
ncbi:uncharacterized protein BCR38DRAFT_414274 [Pseudomassariella vexata]|uniref:Uncharacterized protein n=1 Tax=Pseudomassariella vexata TaxID=1141098 RepID=A0A1Y2DCG8_9PEZI|nr:uncharacterized protein BCR38DRAFT_414274 [Pseudomassariella vexata]ORY56962.1 hypothetical protein BCR38DRAFT_414274 [Pseudomassariella vexata]